MSEERKEKEGNEIECRRRREGAWEGRKEK